MPYEGLVTLVEVRERLSPTRRKITACMLVMVDNQDKVIVWEGKDTGLRTGSRFKISGATGPLVGDEGMVTVSRIEISDHDQTQLPGWAMDKGCLDILKPAKKSGFSPGTLAQLVYQMGTLASEDAKILSQTMVESTKSEEFTLIPKGFRDKLLPFTGAFNGWPIGRMTSFRESEETRLWLENWEKASGKVR